jgi:hypothetical protein
MIEVKIDIVPFGDRSKTRNIRTFIIANDGTGTTETGNYEVMDSNRKKILGRIKNYKRRNNILILVRKAIDVIMKE